MIYTIPFSVEENEQDCLIELLDLSQQETITEIYRGRHKPGIHSVDFDPDSLPEGLEAGVYIIRLTIGDHSESHPLRYMP